MKTIFRKSLLLSAAFPLISFLIYFIFIGSPVYGTNDDVAFNMMISGVFIVNEPTNLVLFIHPMYAEILKLLYEVNIHIPWYGLSFILFAFCALMVFNFSIIRLCNRFNNKDFIWVLLLLNIFITFPILYHLQFTIISGILCISGTSLILSNILFREDRTKSRIIILLIALCLCFIGMMIRFDSAMMILIIIFPILTFLIIKKLIIRKNDYSIRYFIRNTFLVISPIIILLLGIIGIEKSNYLFYRNSDWSYFKEIKESKFISEVLDRGTIKWNDKTIKAFSSVGWTKTDFDMISTWQYVDKEHFNPKIFNNLRNQIISKNSKETINYFLRFKIHLKTTIEQLMSVNYLIFIFIIPFFLMMFKISKSKFLDIIFQFSVLLFSSFLIYVYLACVVNRTLFRTDFLILLVFLSYSLIIFSSIETEPYQTKLLLIKHGFIVRNTLLILAVFFSLSLFKLKFDITQIYVKKMEAQSNLIKNKILKTWLANLPRGSVIYNIGDTFPYEYYLPLNDISVYNLFKEKSIGFIGTGGGNQTPNQINYLKKFKLDEYFYKSLIKYPHVYFVSFLEYPESSNKNKQIFSAFYLEKYSVHVSFKECKDTPMLSKINFHQNISLNQEVIYTY
jgi:hypothetical protein